MRPTRPKKVQNVPGARANVLVLIFSKEEFKDQKLSILMMSMLSTNKKMIKIKYILNLSRNCNKSIDSQQHNLT